MTLVAVTMPAMNAASPTTLSSTSSSMRVRLDKWLWAARFFKTRALAQTAVDGGKVHVDGQRSKSSHPVRIGMRLAIRLGTELRAIEVLALSEQRGPATVAQTLYAETPESSAKRLEQALLRKAMAAPVSAGKPDKQQRRQLRQWQQQNQHE